MPRTRTTNAKPARNAKPKAAPAAAETPKAAKPERLTSFESHGSRFFRITVPRSFGEAHLAMAGAETWDFDEKPDGTLVFTPRTKVAK
jgi:hypothetical protein